MERCFTLCFKLWLTRVNRFYEYFETLTLIQRNQRKSTVIFNNNFKALTM